MPKKCIKFIPEYLIPSLNNKTFGERLIWIDKDKKIFEIDWRHKSGPEWSEEQAQVFVEWDKHKGHFNPENKNYYTQSKQRFRALLYKLTLQGQLKELPSETKFKKVYCIGTKNKRKKADLNTENECRNEDHSNSFLEETTEEELEYESTDDIHSRRISQDDVVNVLEDHTYSISDCSESNITDAENELTLNTFQDTWIPISSSESSSDNSQKKVLVERNYANTLVPSYYIEHSRDGPANSTTSIPAASQNAVSPDLALDDSYNWQIWYSDQQSYTEFWEWYQNPF